MTTFQPLTPNWLSPAWDNFSMGDPELQSAYEWPDYPSDMSGEGNWVDLFLTESEEHPIGRLWMNPDSEDIGLQEIPGANLDYLTKSALELREFNHHGCSVRQAYDFVKACYYAGEEETGELGTSVVTIDA